MHLATAFVAVGFLLAEPFHAFPASAFEQSAPQRPQEPKRPFPYVEENVYYSNPAAEDVVLVGTFTKPSSQGPFPTVLLLSGPGPLDRDESTAGHKPFLVLADYLTRKGLAVLRADMRGTAKSKGKFETATTQDFASDAEAGVHYLMSRRDVDQKHIGLIGHGEGAIVAPMAAVKMPQISFVVLLAGTAVPGEDVLLEQTRRGEIAARIPDDQVEVDYKIGKKLYDMARQGKSEADMRQALESVPQQYQDYVAPWRAQLRRLQSPWLRFFLSYDPAATLAQLKCPVLALEGEKDMQVPPEQNVAATKKALKRAGDHDSRVELLPGLNYMFRPADTGFGWEYARIPETISPKVLERIGDWIEQRVH